VAHRASAGAKMRGCIREQKMGREIPIRKLQVDLAKGFRKRWHGDDLYRTCLFNTFSMSFPVLEDYIADVVRGFLPDLELAGQGVLLEEARALIGQESSHRHLHRQYNAQLEKQGFSNWVGRSQSWRIRLFRQLPRMDKLAIVAGVEHVMAGFGDGLLRRDEWLDGADEDMAKIWRWHAAEETEHKSVAFDVYRFAGGGFVRRICWYLLVTLGLAVEVQIQTMLSLMRERALIRPSVWRSAARFWLWRSGVLWQALPLWASYFSPRFHPWQHDNTDLLAAWRVRYQGEVRVIK
jgi:predicted metal-dependent hydrolase